MKNILGYYYNVHPLEISHTKDTYFFEYNNNKYVFIVCKRPIDDLKALYEVNKEMLKKDILVHEIILNNENEVVTNVNNKPFVLMRLQININAPASLYDIYNINFNTVDIKCDSSLNRYDWVMLWESKNDYFEAQINEIGKKYPNASVYLNYYIGLAENAIKYAKNAINLKDDTRLCISHRRIRASETLFSLYNPLNYVYDYVPRDMCEYIKSMFFINEVEAYDLVVNYFNSVRPNYKEALLFYARLLYPSYFFDIYDEIVNNNSGETQIEKYIIKSSSYEKFLQNVYFYMSSVYQSYIPSVDWIIKRSY